MPAAISGLAGDDDLRRPRGHVDAALGRDNRLRRSDKQIARPNNLVDAADRLRAVRQRSNRLRSADAIELRHAGQPCRGQRLPRGLGEQTTIRSTPATCAGVTVISSVEGSG